MNLTGHGRHAAAAALAAAALGPAATARADCRDIFPAARVQEHVQAPRFAGCAGAAQGYGEHLLDQQALLLALRAAYERKLGGSDTTAQKLADYDAAVLKLGPAAARSAKLAAAVAASAPAAAASQAAMRDWLKDSKTLAQALGSRIAPVAGQLDEHEQVAFCRHDFVLRVLLELHQRLLPCVPAP